LIASVRGEVLVRRPNHVVVEASGVGYRLAVSAETLKSVPARGSDATLHTHLVARDDALSLYGFASEEERDLFLQLISVNGVGPKVALAVLSGGAPRELLRAIAAGDAKRFQAVPGIGKRTAERIIVELREKIAEALDEAALAGAAEDSEPRTLAREGLVNLGYSPVEAERLLDDSEGDSAEELIGAALRRAAEASSSGAKAA
jgi:holliday junction DNA helicase RuvA